MTTAPHSHFLLLCLLWALMTVIKVAGVTTIEPETPLVESSATSIPSTADLAKNDDTDRPSSLSATDMTESQHEDIENHEDSPKEEVAINNASQSNVTLAQNSSSQNTSQNKTHQSVEPTHQEVGDENVSEMSSSENQDADEESDVTQEQQEEEAEKDKDDFISIDKFKQDILDSHARAAANTVDSPDPVGPEVSDPHPQTPDPIAVEHPPANKKYEVIDESFNYAAATAGAKILSTSKGTKAASSILVSDADKYMMSPCSQMIWFIVQLSEDIMIRTVSIANLEHYSSGVEHFQVLGSPTFPTDRWQLLGDFIAQNTHEQQVFELQDSGWVRYLKFRLLSHYGHEYYCTLTNIQAFGITMLSHFAEDMEKSSIEASELQQRLRSSFENTEEEIMGDEHDDEEFFEDEEELEILFSNTRSFLHCDLTPFSLKMKCHPPTNKCSIQSKCPSTTACFWYPSTFGTSVFNTCLSPKFVEATTESLPDTSHDHCVLPTQQLMAAVGFILGIHSPLLNRCLTWSTIAKSVTPSVQQDTGFRKAVQSVVGSVKNLIRSTIIGSTHQSEEDHTEPNTMEVIEILPNISSGNTTIDRTNSSNKSLPVEASAVNAEPSTQNTSQNVTIAPESDNATVDSTSIPPASPGYSKRKTDRPKKSTKAKPSKRTNKTPKGKGKAKTKPKVKGKSEESDIPKDSLEQGSLKAKESIFKTLANRIKSLEVNQSLSNLYIENVTRKLTKSMTTLQLEIETMDKDRREFHIQIRKEINETVGEIRNMTSQFIKQMNQQEMQIAQELRIFVEKMEGQMDQLQRLSLSSDIFLTNIVAGCVVITSISAFLFAITTIVKCILCRCLIVD